MDAANLLDFDRAFINEIAATSKPPPPASTASSSAAAARRKPTVTCRARAWRATLVAHSGRRTASENRCPALFTASAFNGSLPKRGSRNDTFGFSLKPGPSSRSTIPSPW